MTVNTKISKKKARIQERIRKTAEGLARYEPLWTPSILLTRGDALASMADIPDGAVDAIITDPPYGIKLAEWDGAVPGVDVWSEALRILVPGAFCVVAAAPRTAYETASALAAAGFEVRDTFVWRYNQAYPGAKVLGDGYCSGLHANHEPWVVARKPVEKGLSLAENWAIHLVGALRMREDGRQGNVLSVKKPRPAERNLGVKPGKTYHLPAPMKRGGWKNSATNKNTHPTLKPLGLCRRLVRTFSPPKSIVFDPFMGSGTTLMAAAAEGRTVLGTELHPGYFELAEDRIDWAFANPHLVPEAA
jgi:site-specific DNA-methyltransferase (adenine-specific)